MGLFDSNCAVTALSLAPLGRVACVPLARAEDGRFLVRGPAVLGRPDREGGIDAPQRPGAPFALIAGPVYDALKAGGSDLEPGLARRGIQLVPSAGGHSHTEGDVLRAYVGACARWADDEALSSALAEYARLAEAEAAARLGSEAPPAGWLVDSSASWYGVVIGAERRASTSFDGLCAHIERLAASVAFDAESLRRVETGLVLVAQRGQPVELDVWPFLSVEHDGRRAGLDDRALADDVFAGAETDPPVLLDREALATRVPPLPAPQAKHGAWALVGSSQLERPAWVSDESAMDLTLATASRPYWTTAHGLTIFARVTTPDRD